MYCTNAIVARFKKKVVCIGIRVSSRPLARKRKGPPPRVGGLLKRSRCENLQALYQNIDDE